MVSSLGFKMRCIKREPYDNHICFKMKRTRALSLGCLCAIGQDLQIICFPYRIRFCLEAPERGWGMGSMSGGPQQARRLPRVSDGLAMEPSYLTGNPPCSLAKKRGTNLWCPPPPPWPLLPCLSIRSGTHFLWYLPRWATTCQDVTSSNSTLAGKLQLASPPAQRRGLQVRQTPDSSLCEQNRMTSEILVHISCPIFEFWISLFVSEVKLYDVHSSIA